MPGVDQFRRHRRGARQHAQPAEGVDALEVADRIGRCAGAAHAVVAVAAGDEVARELVIAPVLAGSVMGILILRYIPQKAFNILALVLAGIAAVRLILV